MSEVKKPVEEKSSDGPEKLSKVNVEAYVDPEGVTVKQLEFGYWVAAHRRHFFWAIAFVLVFVGAVSWTYTLYGFGHYLIWGMKEDKALVEDMVAASFSHAAAVEQIARPINLTQPRIFTGYSGKKDILAEVANPNAKHGGTFSYRFLSQGTVLASGESYILPGERKYLMALGQELNTASVVLEIDNVRWQRINAHFIEDWEVFRSSRLNIRLSEVKFTPGFYSGLSNRVSLNTLAFRAENNTAYGYWQVDFAIILKQRNEIVGVNFYSEREFEAGENKIISLSWPGQLGRVDDIEIVPAVNIIDESSYLKPAAE